MPRALFAGVFFVVGFSGIPGFNITQNLLYCMTERQFIDSGDARLTLTKSRIFYYTMFQVVGVAISVAISQTIGAIGFPVIIVSLIPLRWCILPLIFTEHELLILDAPTAESDNVLCSLGGETGRSTASAQSSEASQAGAVRSREGFKDADEENVEMDKERVRQRERVEPTSNTGHD
jgi:hypothetical protein